MRRLVLLGVVVIALAGCERCGKPPKPKEEHVALTGCSFDALGVYPLFDATIISFTSLRFALATADGLDTSISEGFVEEVARTGRAEPEWAKIRAITGRRDDLWVVVEGFASPSSDVLPASRLVRRRGGKWQAVPPIEQGAIYDPPALYRGGAISIVRQLGRDGSGRRVVGIDLPKDVDAAKLFPEDVWSLHALDSGHVVADARSGLHLLGPHDPQAKPLRVPKGGSRKLTGTTRARFRVGIERESYRLEGDRLVLAETLEAGDAEVAVGRMRFFEGHDGESFTSREEANVAIAKTTLTRERRPKEIIVCPDR